jgi:hypothetical protein
MKNRVRVGAISLLVLLAGCVTNLQIAVDANIGKLSFAKPFPVKGALFIPPETRNYRYQSPEYIPSRPQLNFESIRPFELPLGEAFAQAAYRTFSQLFQEIQVISPHSKEEEFPLVVDLRIEEFRLDLEYATHGYRRLSPLLDVQGLLRARLRLDRPGKGPWEKVYEAAILPDRIAVNPWTEEAVGKRVSQALTSLFERIAWDMGEEAEPPREPVKRWLNQ